MAKYEQIETRLIHSGEPVPRIDGAVITPIFQTAMFDYADEGEPLRYLRYSNTPNHETLHIKLAALENAEAAIVASSGMAAISTALLSVLSTSDHLIAQNCLYGGTYDFIRRDLPDYGIEYDLVGADPEEWRRCLKPRTRAIYVETMTNPLLQVIDLRAVVAFAREHGILAIIDNTFASPINFRPAEWGFDLSLHSCTKYLNGHSDIVAGAVIGSAALVSRISAKMKKLGCSLDPHAAFLLNRGLKTLALRIRQQNLTALTLARVLEQHPKVMKVYYAGLQAHPDHMLARNLLDGFGGVLSFEIEGGLDVAKDFLKRLRIPIIAPSLGGIETLVSRPAVTSHAALTSEQRQVLGISDSLIRVSVGIENTEELVADFLQALSL